MEYKKKIRKRETKMVSVKDTEDVAEIAYAEGIRYACDQIRTKVISQERQGLYEVLSDLGKDADKIIRKNE